MKLKEGTPVWKGRLIKSYLEGQGILGIVPREILVQGWRQGLRDSPTVLGAPRARAAQSPVNGTNIAELGTWTFEEG